ncbi:MAG: hypothetical protein OXE52_20380 [Chloroflexi bacterium]|nr:hypothetical protein [Chloroflexota bacterium]
MVWRALRTDWTNGELVSADDMNAIGESLAALKEPEPALSVTAIEIFAIQTVPEAPSNNHNSRRSISFGPIAMPLDVFNSYIGFQPLNGSTGDHLPVIWRSTMAYDSETNTWKGSCHDGIYSPASRTNSSLAVSITYDGNAQMLSMWANAQQYRYKGDRRYGSASLMGIRRV